MLKAILTVLLVTGFSAQIKGQQLQNAGLKIINAAYDSVNKAAIIPDSIFCSTADVLFINIPFDTTVKKEKYGFSICWLSPYINGELILTINKKQIAFTSEYNSPHPSDLYWFVNISPEQYKLIAAKINANPDVFEERPSPYFYYKQLFYKKYNPELKPPNKWSSKKIEKHYADWLKKRYDNLQSLISIINAGLPDKYLIPFLPEKEFNKLKSIRLAFSKDDLQKQIEYYELARKSDKN